MRDLRDDLLGISVYYQNVRGLRTKLRKLELSVLACDYHVILLTESGLHDGISNSELGLNGFSVFRCDRNVNTSLCSRLGGVLAAVNSAFSVKQVESGITNVEHLFLSLNIKNIKILIGLVYIPPRSTRDVYDDFSLAVSRVLLESVYDHVYICGDFNLPGIQWISDQYGSTAVGPITFQTECISDVCATFNLFQANNVANFKGGFLDLILTRDDALIPVLAEEVLLDCDAYHPALNFFIPVKTEAVEFMQYNYYCFNFSQANFVGINDYLGSIDWSEILNFDCVNAALDVFYSVIFGALEIFVPKRVIKNRKFPLWFSNELKSLVFEKKRAHRNFKSSNLPVHYEKFVDLRKRCKILTEKCHIDYIKGLENSFISDSSEFWKYVRKKNSSTELPKSMMYGNVSSEDPLEIVEFFARFFSTVYCDPIVADRENCCSFLDNINCDIPLNISLSDILAAIDRLNVKLGCGPDDLPAILLIKCKFVFARILYILYNLSISSGRYPEAWKQSYVFPIFKSGDKSNIENYRPISKVSICAKVLESIIADKLSYFLKDIIIDNQHGFVTGRSTVSNLICFVQDVFGALENRCQLDAIYTDFSKAFDRVDHVIMMEKLRALGIRDPLLSWFRSFLSNRKQFVKVKNCTSSEIAVLSGVPQGSHLSPYLFNCFINDIGTNFKFCNFLLYADDLKLYRSISSIEDCYKIQQDLNNLSDWCNLNSLCLNLSKCHVMSFYRLKSLISFDYGVGERVLDHVGTVKDLGVTLDSALTFNDHINITCNRGLKLLGFLNRSLSDFHNVNCFKSLYCSFIRSVLEYACPVWSPYYGIHIQRLERVQKKFLRLISYKLSIPVENIDYDYLLKFLSIDTLYNRRILLDLCYLFKLLNNKIDCSRLRDSVSFHSPARDTRLSVIFSIPYHRTNYGFYSPLSRMCREANCHICNVNLFSQSFYEFRNTLRSTLKNG